MFVQTHFQRNRLPHSAESTKIRPQLSKYADCHSIEKSDRRRSVKGDYCMDVPQNLESDERVPKKTVSLGSKSYLKSTTENTTIPIKSKASKKSRLNLTYCCGCSVCSCEFNQDYRTENSCPLSVSCENPTVDTFGHRYSANLPTNERGSDIFVENEPKSNHWYRRSYCDCCKHVGASINRKLDLESRTYHLLAGHMFKTFFECCYCFTRKAFLDKTRAINIAGVFSTILERIKFYMWLFKYFCSSLITQQFEMIRFLLDGDPLVATPVRAIMRGGHLSKSLTNSSRPIKTSSKDLKASWNWIGQTHSFSADKALTSKSSRQLYKNLSLDYCNKSGQTKTHNDARVDNLSIPTEEELETSLNDTLGSKAQRIECGSTQEEMPQLIAVTHVGKKRRLSLTGKS